MRSVSLMLPMPKMYIRDIFITDGQRDGHGHAHHDDGHLVRQQVAHNDAPRRSAQAPGRKVIIPVTDDNALVAHKARHRQPARQAHGEDQRPHAGPHNVGKQNAHDRLRNIVHNIVPGSYTHLFR